MRRVRVPSNVDQFSDVDQYLDDLFSPVLDGSLDELSDARSLSTSIRGGQVDYFEAPEIDTEFEDLQSANKLNRVIKGGGHKNDNKENEKQSKDEELNNATALDEYITGETYDFIWIKSISWNLFFMDKFNFIRIIERILLFSIHILKFYFHVFFFNFRNLFRTF